MGWHREVAVIAAGKNLMDPVENRANLPQGAPKLSVEN